MEDRKRGVDLDLKRVHWNVGGLRYMGSARERRGQGANGKCVKLRRGI